MTIKILCIEDDKESLELLAEALITRGYEVITAEDGLSGLQEIFRIMPDIVICDILLPELSGFEILEQISAENNDRLAEIPFIFLTALDDRESILRGRRMGADDYITKPVDYDVLTEIIKRRVSPMGRHPFGTVPALTERETEILTWVARGKSSTDIGTMLGISERTVDYHVEKIMRKLDVGTRIQAAVRASRLKLISL